MFSEEAYPRILKNMLLLLQDELPVFAEGEEKGKEFCNQHIQIFSSWSGYKIFFKILRHTSSDKTISINLKETSHKEIACL